LLELRAGEHRIEEEAAAAAAVLVARIEQHALLAAGGEHHVADLGERRLRMSSQSSSDLGIAEVWGAAAPQRKGGIEHDKAPGIARLEAAATIAQLALRALELA
jgi:hypothetical protein